MTTAKQDNAPKQDNARGQDNARSDDKPPRGNAGKTAPDEAGDIRERLDQVGAILGKGLDLAEAGVSLGVTIVNRLGTVAQKQVLDRVIAAAFQPGAGAPAEDTPAAGFAPPPGPEAGAMPGGMPGGMPGPGPEAPPAPAFCITNRVPLAPGGPLRVTFSINNDSQLAPKKVALRVEGFAGEVTGAVLSASAVTVKPAARTIAPVDFEKFTLRGVVPVDTPPDVYLGWIVVDSEEQLRIPLRLTVSL